MSMEKKTSYFVRFHASGSICDDTWEKEIESPDPYLVEWPMRAYAFSIWKRTDVIDGETTYTGEPEKVGKLYYHPDSTIKTLDEVKADPTSTKILISNMEINRWDALIYTRFGHWPQPYEADRIEILEKREVTS